MTSPGPDAMTGMGGGGKGRRFFAVVGAVALMGAALAQPAAAEDEIVSPQASSDCPAGQMCFWTSVQYGGQMYGRSTTGTLAASTARSAWNRTGKAVRVYASASGSGSSTCLAAGTQLSTTLLATGKMVILTTSC
ncbi:hypothetical protein FH969_00950 [Miniimonas arenae]|uniref:Peptidase inhibitor family I36 protein n=3 Tax=Miniimonas TaxID=947525 RepID=A0A5C5BI67_9MICO|nr:hypothetical protein FH969_00950 [Miniimonas arenae]